MSTYDTDSYNDILNYLQKMKSADMPPMKYKEFFNNRTNTFLKSYELMLKRMKPGKTYTIVELGTSRSFVSGNMEG